MTTKINQTKNILFILLTIFFLLSCEEKTVQPTINIEEAYNQWKSLGINNYSVIQIKKCFCVDAGIKAIITVKNENIVSVQDSLGQIQIPQERWQYFKTINQLFETAIQARKNNPADFIIEYDEQYKYPTYLYVNPSSKTVDDEYGFSTYNLIPKR